MMQWAKNERWLLCGLGAAAVNFQTTSCYDSHDHVRSIYWGLGLGFPGSQKCHTPGGRDNAPSTAKDIDLRTQATVYVAKRDTGLSKLETQVYMGIRALTAFHHE